MISSFCSCDFGYRFTLSTEQLLIVNQYREGKQYIVDEEAALEVTKQVGKQPQHSPFVRKFEYEINSEGYWTYHNMVVQLEDVTDLLKALCGNQYHFIFSLIIALATTN